MDFGVAHPPVILRNLDTLIWLVAATLQHPWKTHYSLGMATSIPIYSKYGHGNIQLIFEGTNLWYIECGKPNHTLVLYWWPWRILFPTWHDKGMQLREGWAALGLPPGKSSPPNIWWWCCNLAKKTGHLHIPGVLQWQTIPNFPTCYRFSMLQTVPQKKGVVELFSPFFPPWI